ncbi:MAG TPA: hypothetical protein VGF40_03555 [Thermoanaerobaculia bacterium]
MRTISALALALAFVAGPALGASPRADSKVATPGAAPIRAGALGHATVTIIDASRIAASIDAAAIVHLERSHPSDAAVAVQIRESTVETVAGHEQKVRYITAVRY